MKITLCKKDLNGEDIPTVEYNDKEKALNDIDVWVFTKNLEESVFVCFTNFSIKENGNYRDEQQSFLVSHEHYDIMVFTENQLDCHNWNELDYSIFEFPSYQDAFDYCKDLKESF